MNTTHADYLSNASTHTDATISFDSGFYVVEISRLQHGGWMTQETRKFGNGRTDGLKALELARDWARRRLRA